MSLNQLFDPDDHITMNHITMNKLQYQFGVTLIQSSLDYPLSASVTSTQDIVILSNTYYQLATSIQDLFFLESPFFFGFY